MLAGKNYNYKGPRTHYAIIKKILVESRKKRRAMNLYKIEKIVRLFFNLRHGLARYFSKGNNFSVKGVGRFKPDPTRRGEAINSKIRKRMLLREKYRRFNRSRIN